MAYEGSCGSCGMFSDAKTNNHYDTSNSDDVKGFCIYYRSFYYPTENACDHYLKPGSGSSSSSFSSSSSSSDSDSDCYITTIVCNILGYPDDCDVLTTLRDFRNNVLQKNKKYSSLLFQYDTLGPMIASKIEDNNVDNRKRGYYPPKSIMAEYLQSCDKTFIRGIYDSFLLPIVGFIKNGFYDKAVSQYIKMTRFLQECYEIDYAEEMPGNYDFQRGGHGFVALNSSKKEPAILKKCRA